MLAINLGWNANVVWQGLPGIGKTTAMVLSMLCHCDPDFHHTQILCLTASYEATRTVVQMVQNLAHYPITCQAITYDQPWNGISSQILVGTALEMAKLASTISLQYIKLICFDDADLTMPFSLVSENILKPTGAKIFATTSSLNKTILSKAAPCELFAINKHDVLKLNITHMIISHTDDKMLTLSKIFEAMGPKDRAAVFCRVT